MKTVCVEVSEESFELLEHLADKGIYGNDVEQVCARFVDAALVRIVEAELVRRQAAKTGRKR